MDIRVLDSENSAEIFQAHLNRVSRSFAVCIARLEMPFRKWVGLAYLLCRILDTIEDTDWNSEVLREQAFKKLDEFVNWSAPEGQELQRWDRLAIEIKRWAEGFPPGITDGELTLLRDSPYLLYEMHFAPQSIRDILQELLRTMSGGMRQFAKLRRDPDRQKDLGGSLGSQLVLKNLSEVNQYCFFVAGIVGEALTKILKALRPDVNLSKDAIGDAHRFGLFLQKVNILKDQVKDELDGRYLVPDREELLTSLIEDARAAYTYIQNIPIEQSDYRVFCLWSLFLGLKTLPLLKYPAQNLNLQKNKIGRDEMTALFTQVEQLAQDPVSLEDLYLELWSAKLG